ncbi:MAG: CHAT domain-containing tetratricopeptide repeat protein [Chitinophagales bacterium]
MKYQTPSINALELLQQAKSMLEQNELTEQVVQLLKEAADKFEAQKTWDIYLQAQIQTAIFYIKTSKFSTAETLLNEALLKTAAHLNKNTIEVGDTFNQLATCAYYQANYPIAQHFFEQALLVYQANYGENHRNTARTYSNLGNCCYAQNLLDDALSYYQKSLDIRQLVLPSNHPDFAFSYSALARCYHIDRNFKKALLYFQQALAIRIHQHGEEHLMVSYSYTDLSSCFKSLHEFAKSRECNRKALEIRQKIYKKPHPSIANCYSKIGDSYLQEGDLSSALKQYELAVEIQLGLLVENHPDLADNYAQMGKCLTVENPEKGLDYLQKALKIYQQVHGQYHKKTAMALDYIGRFYNYHQDYPQALQYFQKTIHSLCEKETQSIDFDEQTLYQTPQIDHYLSAERLTKPIVSKAKIFYQLYQQNQNLKDIRAAYEHYEQLIWLVDELKKLQGAETEQLFFSGEVANFYEDAMKIALTYYEHTNNQSVLEKVFLFAEKGKAAVLLSALQRSEAKLQSNIPPALLQKSKTLEIKLSDLEKQLKITSDAVEYQRLQNELFGVTRQYETLTNQLEADYPEYYQLKYKVKTTNISELQVALKSKQTGDSLHPTTLLLSYYVGESLVYIFEVTADSYQVHQLPKPTDLEDKILDFQDAVNLMDVEDYIETASELYELLLAPVLDKWGIPTSIPQKMIVLRHDLLDYIPFEALLIPMDEMETNGFIDLPYLIHYYEISYHYSTALLLRKIRQSKNTSIRQNSFLGFAPVSFNGKEEVELAMESHRGTSKVLRSNRAGETALQNLPNTETEVKDVYQLFQDKELDAKAFLYASASKENLIKEAANHKYLLISTHGFVEDEEAGLSGIYMAAPQDNKNYLLYTTDTYHLDLHADLVVLSSCSSGVGKLQKGEGMMAINRGFLYAGASNIIFTQFDIPDQSSSRLVKKLFEYILEGDAYTTALRKAKLHLLQEKSSSVQDWAGYLLIGV